MEQLSYKLVGRPDGPWLVWLHGMFGSHLDLEPIAIRFQSSHRSVLVDLPGHAGSALVPARSVSEVAARVASLLESIGAMRSTVIGYSLGGRVAVDLLRQHPGLIAALVLESASPGLIGLAERHRRLARDREWSKRMAATPPAEFFAAWYRQPVFRSLRSNRNLLARISSTRCRSDWQALTRAIVDFSAGQQIPSWYVLASRQVPLMFVAGRRDGKYVAIGRRACAVSPRSTLVTAAGAGHVVHAEAPDEYARSLARFFRTVPQNRNVRR